MNTQDTGSAVAVATIESDGRGELLAELRTRTDLDSTPEGRRLLLRIEGLVNSNQALGLSQITNAAAMKAYMEFGTFVSKGNATLPDHLRGNAADCTAIAMRADRWGLDFYGVAEKTHIVSGKLGYEAQLVGAILKNMGAIKESFHDEYFGDWTKINGRFVERESKTQKDKHGNPSKYKVPAWKAEDEQGCGVRIWATLAGEKEPRYLEVLMTQALVRNSTLWASNPQQQIFYLAEKLWARKYAPEALLGVHTVDDLQEMAPPRDMGPADVVPPQVPTALLAAAEGAAKKGVAAYQKFFAGTGADNRKALAAEHQRLKDTAVDADRARTVESVSTATQAPVAAATADAPMSAAQAADPGTGEVDAGFVAAMEAAETKAGSK